LLAGVDLIVLRHPESLKRVKKILSSLTGGA
jgi:CO dehydrogenase/acetyl-CoA synthase delta subunit